MPGQPRFAAFPYFVLCILALTGMPNVAHAVDIDFTDLEYASRSYSYPTDPTPSALETGAIPPGPSNYQTIFNSLPASTPGYGATSLTSFTDVSNAALFGASIGMAQSFTASFTLSDTTGLTVRAGGDWGYGGILLVDGIPLQQRFPSVQGSTDADMFWAFNFNSPSQYLQGAPLFGLNAGISHTVQVVGFDNCCGAAASLEFSTDQSTYFPITLGVTTAPTSVPPSLPSDPISGCAIVGTCRTTSGPIGTGTITFESRPFSFPANPTPAVFATGIPSPFNYKTIFNSLPTNVAGYGTKKLSTIQGTSNQSLIPGGSGVNTAEQYTAEFTTAQAGDYLFRAGGDEGYGGILMVDGQILEQKWPTTQGGTDADMSWAGNWADRDQYLAGEISLPAGLQTLSWTGFDSCCDGSAELDYSTDLGATWQAFSVTADVPEPASWLILACGCAVLRTVNVRRRRRFVQS